MWHLRESIPLAQSRRRRQHQARHRAAGLGDRRVRRRAPTPRCCARSPACAWSTSATSATATCTTTCRRPPGAAAPTSSRDYETAINAHRLRRGRRARRLDLGRARHRRAQARRAGAAQVAGRARHDAGDQERARSRRRAEPGARAARLAATASRSARTSGLRAGRPTTHHEVAARRDDGVAERRDQLLARAAGCSISGTRPSATPCPAIAAEISWSYDEKCSTPAGLQVARASSRAARGPSPAAGCRRRAPCAAACGGAGRRAACSGGCGGAQQARAAHRRARSRRTGARRRRPRV